MLLTVKNVPNITVYVSVMKNLRMRNSKNTCRLSGWPIRNCIRNLQSVELLKYPMPKIFGNTKTES